MENKNEEEEWRKFPLAVYLCRYLSGYSVMEAVQSQPVCLWNANYVLSWYAKEIGHGVGTTEAQLRSEVDGQYQGCYYILKGFLEYS